MESGQIDLNIEHASQKHVNSHGLGFSPCSGPNESKF